jgi:hypothetical protein
MSMGFFVSSNLALKAIERISNNISGFGLRFHASVKDPRKSPWTVPHTVSNITARIEKGIGSGGGMELAVVAERSFLPQTNGLVVIIGLCHRGMYEGKFHFSKYNASHGHVQYPYEDSRAARAGWSKWGTAFESEDYQKTNNFFNDGLSNCGETITDERILDFCINNAVMPSEIVQMQAQNPLLGAAKAGGADPAAAARAAERARRGL